MSNEEGFQSLSQEIPSWTNLRPSCGNLQCQGTSGIRRNNQMGIAVNLTIALAMKKKLKRVFVQPFLPHTRTCARIRLQQTQVYVPHPFMHSSATTDSRDIPTLWHPEVLPQSERTESPCLPEPGTTVPLGVQEESNTAGFSRLTQVNHNSVWQTFGITGKSSEATGGRRSWLVQKQWFLAVTVTEYPGKDNDSHNNYGLGKHISTALVHLSPTNSVECILKHIAYRAQKAFVPFWLVAVESRVSLSGGWSAAETTHRKYLFPARKDQRSEAPGFSCDPTARSMMKACFFGLVTLKIIKFT